MEKARDRARRRKTPSFAVHVARLSRTDFVSALVDEMRHENLSSPTGPDRRNVSVPNEKVDCHGRRPRSSLPASPDLLVCPSFLRPPPASAASLPRCLALACWLPPCFPSLPSYRYLAPRCPRSSPLAPLAPLLPSTLRIFAFPHPNIFRLPDPLPRLIHDFCNILAIYSWSES